MQAPLQSLKVALHWHWFPEHVEFVGHSVVMQQPVAGMHWLPQGLKVGLHSMPQVVPSQVAFPFEGTAHGEQDVPHELTLSFEAHAPPQSCVVAGHWFMHAFSVGMQVPAQGFWPLGQLTPHLVPSHVASPPLGGWQAEQELPQVFGSRLLTHAELHSCWPWEQVQVPSTQLPAEAQSCASQHRFDGIHAVPQRLVPSLHEQTLPTHDSPVPH